MEPFGLFNLLKSIIPQAPPSQEAPPPETANDPPPPLQKQEAETEQNNAFLDFAKAHDERARRTKGRQ